MKVMNAIFTSLIVLAASSAALAKTYTCNVEEPLDAWSTKQPAYTDTLTIKVDTKRGTAEMDSSNELYGKNPFSVLTTAPAHIANKYVKGTEVFAGTNIHDNLTYVLSIDPATKTGSLEAYGKKSKEISDVKCR